MTSVTKILLPKPIETAHLKSIDVDAKAKGFLSSLLFCNDRMEAKQISLDNFLTGKANVSPLPDRDEEFKVNIFTVYTAHCAQA